MTKRTPNTTRYIPSNYTEDFVKWWSIYPRKDGSKQKAFEIWFRITKEISANDLFIYTDKFKRAVHGTEIKYIPHATTWLNQRRWETVKETNVRKLNLNTIAG